MIRNFETDGEALRLLRKAARSLGPFGDQRHVGKTLGTGEGGARIHHRHVVIERTCQRRQRLADMHRADDDERERTTMSIRRDGTDRTNAGDQLPEESDMDDRAGTLGEIAADAALERRLVPDGG